MRTGGVLLCAGVVALATGCSGGEKGGPSNQHPVNIVFNCNNGGARIEVHPWRVKPRDSTDEIKWNLSGGAREQSVRIVAKSPSPWPLRDPEPTIKNDSFVITRGLKAAGIDSGTYKYNIIGICTNGKEADTVVLDPDMIIPY